LEPMFFQSWEMKGNEKKNKLTLRKGEDNPRGKKLYYAKREEKGMSYS